MPNYKAISGVFIALTVVFAATAGYLFAFPNPEIQTLTVVKTSTSTTTTTQSTPPPVPKDNPCLTPIPGDTLQLGRTYALAGEDTFTKDASVGSFAQGSVTDASYLTPIYTGDRGMGCRQ